MGSCLAYSWLTRKNDYNLTLLCALGLGFATEGNEECYPSGEPEPGDWTSCPLKQREWPAVHCPSKARLEGMCPHGSSSSMPIPSQRVIPRVLNHSAVLAVALLLGRVTDEGAGRRKTLTSALFLLVGVLPKEGQEELPGSRYNFQLCTVPGGETTQFRPPPTYAVPGTASPAPCLTTHCHQDWEGIPGGCCSFCGPLSLCRVWALKLNHQRSNAPGSSALQGLPLPEDLASGKAVTKNT